MQVKNQVKDSMQGMIPKGGLEKGGRELTRVQVTVGKVVSAVSSDPWAGRRRLWNSEPRGPCRKTHQGTP